MIIKRERKIYLQSAKNVLSLWLCVSFFVLLMKNNTYIIKYSLIVNSFVIASTHSL